MIEPSWRACVRVENRNQRGPVMIHPAPRDATGFATAPAPKSTPKPDAPELDAATATKLAEEYARENDSLKARVQSLERALQARRVAEVNGAAPPPPPPSTARVEPAPAPAWMRWGPGFAVLCSEGHMAPAVAWDAICLEMGWQRPLHAPTLTPAAPTRAPAPPPAAAPVADAVTLAPPRRGGKREPVSDADKKAIGKRLRAARTKLGLTQRQLALRLGCHQVTIGQIECGRMADRRGVTVMTEKLAAKHSK